MRNQNDLKNDMRALIAEAMYMEPEEVEGDALFSDFGLESITLVKIVDKLCTKYSCELEVKELLPHQTLDEASSFFYGKLVEEV